MRARRYRARITTLATGLARCLRAWAGGGVRRLLAAVTAIAVMALATIGPPVLAQSPAALVADRVQLAANRQLIAEGNVEVLYGNTRLRARRVAYDRANGSLQITGPITLTDDARHIILADAAELSDDLREGILTSARLVMDRQLQIAAAEMQRLGGRHTVLSRTVASSCRVCAADPVPLWEIRARRVIHDQETRQIHFGNAQLRLAGLPVLWLPHLRMPDPTLARSRGFLMPRVVSSSRLGFGVKVPYFIPLGPNRDLTVTPFLASKSTRTLELRYRQAFRNGAVTLTGAWGRDRTRNRPRGWLQAQGRFALPLGFGLTFDGRMISDPAYLRDYGLSDDDRLVSRLEIARTRMGEHLSARLVHTHSIRAGEVNAELPQFAADARWIRRLAVPGIGGTATLGLEVHGHRRSSTTDMIGRDVARASVSAFWRRDWLGPAGILLAVEAGAITDLHRIRQDSRWPRSRHRTHPGALVELRWPWARADQRGNSDVIEPVVQLVWSRRPPLTGAPNEDSTQIEFDEGNLFGLSRFPGADRREGGRRLNAGLQWTRQTATGWHIAASLGRVFRLSGRGQFTAASGLGGRRSDWVGALHLATPGGTGFQGRAIFDDAFSLTRGEMRLAVERDRYGLAAGWLWAAADAAESRPVATSEWVIDGRLQLATGWTARAGTRYDFRANRTTAAALGLEYANECLRLDLTLARRPTSSPQLPTTTDFGFSIDFLGFGGGRPAGPVSGACRF